MVCLLAMATMSSYLVVDHLVIGSVEDGAWTRHETVEESQMPITFTKVGLGKTFGTWTVNGLIKGGVGDAGYINAEGKTHLSGVLFSGKPAFPRKVQILSNSNATYVSVLKSYLRKHKLKSSARITRVVRVDLDGDGSQEVIIEASNRDDLAIYGMHGARKGDYSLVLLRAVSKGKVVEIPLGFDHPKPEGMNYENKLVAIADLDGNGTMDIVTTSHYYEGQSAILFGFKGGKIQPLVEMGDGV